MLNFVSFIETRQVDGIRSHRIWYCTHWSYSPFPVVSRCLGKSFGQIEHPGLALWAYDQSSLPLLFVIHVRITYYIFPDVIYDGRWQWYPGRYVCEIGVYESYHHRSQLTIQRSRTYVWWMLVSYSDLMTGENNIRLCLHIRIFVSLRNRTSCTRTHIIRNRHT